MISKNRLKYYASLKQKKFRSIERKFLIEGIRLCEEAIDSDFTVEEILYCETELQTHRGKQLLEKFQALHVSSLKIDVHTLRKLTDTVHSQGVIGIVQAREYGFPDVANGARTLLALDQVKEPGNLGAILRSASWFGVQGVLLGKGSVESTNPKVVRASMGAFFHLPIVTELDLPEVLQELRDMDYSLFLADQNGDVAYTQTEFGERNVIILGGETCSVSEEIQNVVTASVCIPKTGQGESLNVSVAAGILLSELACRWKKNG